jgi:hypothetical protein
MQRRKFLAAGAAALPLVLGAQSAGQGAPDARQLIELRTYEIKFGGSGQSILLDYLNNALAPALKRLGCADFSLMKVLGDAEPAMIWVLISYPNADTYLQAQDLSEDKTYQKAAAAYQAVPADKPVFNRYASQLLHAFSGMPAVASPGKDAGLFELRTYEGYSEDAVRRKIKMFNVEEIDLFHEVGLHPVFFGKMISGPYRPCLVYMLHFKDMEERNANWGKFGPHPKWKAMVAKPEYADSVSNIRKTFLVPV